MSKQAENKKDGVVFSNCISHWDLSTGYVLHVVLGAVSLVVRLPGSIGNDSIVLWEEQKK